MPEIDLGDGHFYEVPGDADLSAYGYRHQPACPCCGVWDYCEMPDELPVDWMAVPELAAQRCSRLGAVTGERCLCWGGADNECTDCWLDGK